MRLKYIFFLLVISACSAQTPKEFSELALNENFYSLDGNKYPFKEILNQHKGKTILIDVWASWCADCIRGLPKVTQLQKEYPEVVFLFLSVDTNKTVWKNAIQRFSIRGEHYNLASGMQDGDFVEFINLKWIPRYMIIDKNGKIALFKALKASDITIEKTLNNIQ